MIGSGDLLVFGMAARPANVYPALDAEVSEHRISLRAIKAIGKPSAFGALVCLRNLLLRLLKHFDTLFQSVNFLGHSDHLLPHGQLFQQLQQIT